MASKSPRVPRSSTRIYSGIVLAVTTITVGVFIFRKLWGTGNKSQDEGISKPGHPNTSESQPPSIDQDPGDGHKFDVSTSAHSTTPLSQPINHSAGDGDQLGISVPSLDLPTTSEEQFIDQGGRDEHKLDILLPAQISTTPRSQPVDHSNGEKSQLGISVPSHALPTTSEPQFINEQDARDGPNPDISILGQPYTTPRPKPIDYSAGDEGQLGISMVPSQAPLTTLEPQFRVIDQDVKDKDILLPAQTSTSAVTSQPHGDIRSEEVPSKALSQGSSKFQISKTNATIIRNGDGRFTKAQRDLSCEYIANLHIAWPDTNDNLKKHVHALSQSIIIELRAKAMSNDYQNMRTGPCFKGTRVALLREMAGCVTGSSESRMYILSGLADTGKSTVAYTIASRAADLNLLGASFVFSRANHDDVKSFFTTIAYQLCVHNETFAKAIGDTWEAKHGDRNLQYLESLIQQVMLDSLRSIVQSRSRPTLIAVDALDECNEKDAFLVLTWLSRLIRDLPSFRVILTTRPGPYLDRFLRDQGGQTFFHLQDIENQVVNGDSIRLYLSHCLSLDQVQMHFPKQQWCPSDEEIDSLVSAAGRFFIVALMAVLYILDKTASNPAAQMQKLLCATAGDHTFLKDLDRFYTVILQDVVPEDCVDDDIVRGYQSVVGTIIFVQHPFPVSILAHLIGIDVEELRAMLERLQSVILLGDDDVPRVCHKSFPEYLTDQSRCKDPHLQIDPKICHSHVATRCFEIMNKHLKRNILGFGDLARFMDNEDGLEEDGITDQQLQEKIPPQLRYACAYWVVHLEAGNIKDAALMKGLKKFIDEKMLYWFETLSLIEKLDLARPAIDVVLKLLPALLAFIRNIEQKEVIQKWSLDLYQLLLDASQFIEKFYRIIKRSALHTYYSALLFTPTVSLLYRRYNQESAQPHPIFAIDGRPKNWNASLTIMWHEGEDENFVQAQARFSLDSALLVSCFIYKCKQGKVLNIWDPTTGVSISKVAGGTLAIANDFSTVASSVDKTITFYDVNGRPSGTMFTTSKVQELALSCENSRVAAALSDGTICLWDSGNGELIDSFDGFNDSGNWALFQFSSTGTRLTYSSVNGIVKLRDGISGKSVADLQCGSCINFEFSDDGSRIISLSNDYGLTLWDSESGGLIGDVTDVRDCQLAAISADGSLVATAGRRPNVTLWSESLTKIGVLSNSNPFFWVCVTHQIAFSPENILAIATDYDVELYNVTTFSFIHKLSLPDYGTPKALTFSPDCTRLAVGDNKGNVNLWDLRSIDASGAPLEEANPVTALALSRDCSRLACGFEDGTVELWRTSPTKARIASHRAHKMRVRAIGFDPDGGLFASGSNDGTIMLWIGKDGRLRDVPSGLVTLAVEERWKEVEAVALSNSLLVATGDFCVALWSLDTLSPIHTWTSWYRLPTVSIAEDNALIAVAQHPCDVGTKSVSLLDAVNHKLITTFDVPYEIHDMTFLPGNLQLLAQCNNGGFLSFNLINKHITIGASTPEHLFQLPTPSISRWHGVPVLYCRDIWRHCLAALFFQHNRSLPVLWFPRDLIVTKWTQGSSMIALHCQDGRIIFVRPPITYVS